MSTDNVIDVKRGKLSLGDKVKVDGQLCEIIKFGTNSDSVLVRPVKRPKKGRRLACAVLMRPTLERK